MLSFGFKTYISLDDFKEHLGPVKVWLKTSRQTHPKRYPAEKATVLSLAIILCIVGIGCHIRFEIMMKSRDAMDNEQKYRAYDSEEARELCFDAAAEVIDYLGNALTTWGAGIGILPYYWVSCPRCSLAFVAGFG